MYDPHEDDAYLLHALIPELVDEDPEEDHEELDESHVLSVPERLKLAQRMRRMAKRMATLKKLKATRMAPADRLMYRARKAALMALRAKIAGEQGKHYDTLNRNQKIVVDQMVARRFGKGLPKTIDRIARKMMPKVKRHELDRVAHARGVSEQTRLHGRRSKKGATDDLLRDPIRKHKNDEKDGLIDELEAELGIDHLHLTDIGYRDKKDMKINEARKSAYDTEGGNEGDDHIIYQLKKASMARGSHHEVAFKDGTKAPVHPTHAKMALHKYAQLLSRSGPGYTGKDRQAFVKKLGKDENTFYDMIGLKEEKKGKEPVKVVSMKNLLPVKVKNFKNPAAQSDVQGVGATTSQYRGSGVFGMAEAINVESPAADRAKFRKARVPFKQKTPAPVKSISHQSIVNKARRAHSASGARTRKPVSSAQRFRSSGTRLAISQTRRSRLGESAQTNKLGVALNKLKLATEPRPNEDKAAWALRRKQLEADVLKLGGAPYLKKTKGIQENLIKKAVNSQIPYDILEEVFLRGYDEGNENTAFNRVNSFIAGGFAAELDEDLLEYRASVWVDTKKGGGYWRTYEKAPRTTRKPKKPKRKVNILTMTEEGGAGEIGKPETTKKLASETPGQGEIVKDNKYIAELPWDNENPAKEYEQALAGKREVNERALAREFIRINRAMKRNKAKKEAEDKERQRIKDKPTQDEKEKYVYGVGLRLSEEFIAGIYDAPTAHEAKGGFAHHPSVEVEDDD